MTQPHTARIYSRGYRRFDGERTGLAAAIWALVIHSARSVFGFGRPGRYKIAPILFGSLTYLNAIVIAGVAILLGSEFFSRFDFAYSQTVNGNRSMAVLFTAIVAPGILVTDRRNGMFDMYLTTPLNRATYLVGKAAAIVMSLLFVTLGPALVQLVGLTMSNAGPDGPLDWLRLFGQILAAGLLSAALFGSLALAVSAVADRALTAGIAIAVVLLLTSIVGNLLVEVGYHPGWSLISTINTSEAAVISIFGDTDGLAIPTYQRWLAVGAHLGVASGIVAWTYARRGSSR